MCDVHQCDCGCGEPCIPLQDSFTLMFYEAMDAVCFCLQVAHSHGSAVVFYAGCNMIFAHSHVPVVCYSR